MTYELKLSNKVLDGPWQVVTVHPTSDSNWYIYNTATGKFKKVGKVGARRNNYEHAFTVAERLNAELKP